MGIFARLSVLLLLGCLTGLWCSSKVAVRLGMDLGAHVGSSVQSLRELVRSDGPSPEVEMDEAELGLETESNDSGRIQASSLSGKKLKRRVREPANVPAPKKLEATFRIPASQVLALANAGRRPVGQPIQASSRHPSGILVSGLAGLGLPLNNGDVLTHVAGQHVRTVGDVVGLVLALRGRKAPTIFGIFWREGKAFGVAVEQPYLATSCEGCAPAPMP